MTNKQNQTKTNTDPPLSIHFEDDHILVVNKTANLLSQKDKTGDPDVYSLCQSHLSKQGDQSSNISLVHRLDRPVSGLMILAKNTNAARYLSRQLRDRSMQKSYLAIVHGHTPSNGVLTHYLKKNSSTNKVTAVPSNSSNAQYAELAYQQLDHRNGLSLLTIHLQTGRSHQIRVQLSTEGFPIWGDHKYSNISPSESGHPIALFAHQVRFTHPATKKEIELQASPPTTYPWNQFNQPPQ